MQTHLTLSRDDVTLTATHLAEYEQRLTAFVERQKKAGKPTDHLVERLSALRNVLAVFEQAD